MAGYLPPGSSFFPPPPPPRSKWSRQLYSQTPIWQISARPTDNNTASPWAVVGVIIGVIAFLLLLIIVCRYRNSRANAAAHAAAAHATARAATLAARPHVPPRPRPGPDYWSNEDQWMHRDSSDRHDGGGTRRASPTADLPSFTYNRAVRHNVTGSGDEAATCTVCLGAFQAGERVRLLPVCLHLYHVDCIDPWLEAHSTCPVCRSGTDDDPTMHGGMIPMV